VKGVEDLNICIIGAQGIVGVGAITHMLTSSSPAIRVRPDPLPPRVTADDRSAHRAFVRTLGSEAIWRDYFTVRTIAA
jgi:DNA polymerase-3 subunit epsilon